MTSERGQGIVTVFGGTGFVGARIVQYLLAGSITVRIAARHERQTKRVVGRPAVPGAVFIHADVRDERSIAKALDGAMAAVNAVGLYVERGGKTFEAIHERGAQSVAMQCARLGVQRLVHISGIGSDVNSPSRYIRTRAGGEGKVKQAFPDATILRPSAIFDPADKFMNTFAKVATRLPVIPLPGRGRSRLQPVYLGDVAAAAVAAIPRGDAIGVTYELGGPDIFTYRGLYEVIFQQTGRSRPMMPVPFWVWHLVAATCSPMPTPPITEAQVELMRRDNVVSSAAGSLAQLGISATALTAILPEYGFMRQPKHAV